MRKNKWILVAAVVFMLSGCGGKADDHHEDKNAEKHDHAKENAKKHKGEKESEGHSEEKKKVKLSPEAVKNAGHKDRSHKNGSSSRYARGNRDGLAQPGPAVSRHSSNNRACSGCQSECWKRGQNRQCSSGFRQHRAWPEQRRNISRRQTLLELAKTNYEREKSLFDQKIAAKKDVLAAEAEYRKAEAEARSLHERLRLYGLSDQAINNLNNAPSQYTLTSPGAGVVVERDMSKGEVIEAGKKGRYDIGSFDGMGSAEYS